MQYTIRENEQLVVLEPAAAARASVIWLHGLGADGHDFVPLVDELDLPDTAAIRFVFPHAAPRPVTINNGYVMRAWYDIVSLDRHGKEDATGIRESGTLVQSLIAAENARGVPTQKIVLAGFSQGGAIALHAGVRHSQQLAGIMGLSTYLPLGAELMLQAHASNRSTPILMCHGTFDTVVPPLLGELSRDALRAAGYDVRWETYPMEHSVALEEIASISTWLQQRLL